MITVPTALDATDMKLIQLLLEDGRTSWADLGRQLELAPTSVADRYQKLVNAGVLTKTTAVVQMEKFGLGVVAFLYVSLDRSTDVPPFLKFVDSCAEIEECHAIAGDEDYMLKVRVPSLAYLESFIAEKVKSNDGVVRVRSVVATSTRKANPAAGVASGKPSGKKRR